MKFTLLSILSSGSILMPWVAMAQPPSYYVGVGARSQLNDPTSVVINGKASFLNTGEVSLSARPELLLGEDTEFRFPITVEGEVLNRFYPYVGPGLAVNTDGAGNIDPMVTGGLDTQLHKHIVLKLESNLIFQPNDCDLEFITTLNYAFD